MGSAIIEFKDDSMHFVVVVWKGQTSVKAYVQKGERLHYLRLCGADISQFGKLRIMIPVTMHT